jgi:hypothetical protein
MPLQNDFFGRRQLPSPFGSGYASQPVGNTRLWDKFLSQTASATPNPAPARPYYLDAPPEEIAAKTNQFMTGQAVAPYQANLPNYDAMVGQRSNVIGSQLAGQVPDDVLSQILQSAAERGIMTGSPGSPNSGAAWLRLLGQTSMGLQQQGMQNLGAAIESTPVPELLNPASISVPERFAQQEYDLYKKSLSPISYKTGPNTTTTQLPTPFIRGTTPTMNLFQPR